MDLNILRTNFCKSNELTLMTQVYDLENGGKAQVRLVKALDISKVQ